MNHLFSNPDSDRDYRRTLAWEWARVRRGIRFAHFAGFYGAAAVLRERKNLIAASWRDMQPRGYQPDNAGGE